MSEQKNKNYGNIRKKSIFRYVHILLAILNFLCEDSNRWQGSSAGESARLIPVRSSVRSRLLLFFVPTLTGYIYYARVFRNSRISARHRNNFPLANHHFHLTKNCNNLFWFNFCTFFHLSFLMWFSS